MKNSQKGFIAPLFIAIIILLLVGVGFYLYETKKAEAPVVDNGTNVTGDQKILATAREVFGALKARDYQKLENLVSSDGLTLNYFPALDLANNLIAKNEVSLVPTDTTKYFWGYTDGKGDPINLTRVEFITKYIYTGSVDYSIVPDVSV